MNAVPAGWYVYLVFRMEFTRCFTLRVLRFDSCPLPSMAACTACMSTRGQRAGFDCMSARRSERNVTRSSGSLISSISLWNSQLSPAAMLKERAWQEAAAEVHPRWE